MKTVTITEDALGIEDLLAVIDGARVELADRVRRRIAASRAVVDRALAAGEAVYGLTTRVGHGKDTRLSQAEIRSAQRLLVMSHSGGIGPPLPTAIVRAAMAVRLNGIARGGSGAGLTVAETLAAMLNEGVHPLIPETGSVGAGDLAQMAGIAQVAIGMGRAEYRGEILSGGEALRRAGIAPLVLDGKDGLALISANGVSVGHAALVITQAIQVANAADVAAALSMEAIGANTSVLHPAVSRAKPIPGQIAAADHLRALLVGSQLLKPGDTRSVQDALSFRVVPQVHGALREYITAASSAVTTELNAAADNPLVSVPDQALVSNGNFHPMVLTISFDALRIALAQVGLLSDRRMSHLWDTLFGRLERHSTPDLASGLSTAAYGVRLRYPAAALLPELKQLAAPASLDLPPLEMGIEDHGTSAPLSVSKTEAAIGLLGHLLATELLLARDVLATASAAPRLGAGTRAALRMVEQVIATADPRPDAVHRALRDRFPVPPRGVV